MQIVITLVAPDDAAVPRTAIAAAQEACGAGAAPVWLDRTRACDLIAEAPGERALATIRAALAGHLAGEAVDWAVQPVAGRRKRLLVSDMDSTVIGQECVDEIADAVGLRAEVSAITARAMAGELEFEASLSARVKLLGGLAETELGRVMDERITVNPGAATMVATMRAHGAHTLLVSGGFTFCALRIAAMVGFDRFEANRLIIADGRLTGEVARPILGPETKLALMRGACARLGIDASAAVGVGDGANDLALIEEAGLGVAYRARPVLAARADARIDHSDPTAVLCFQGYTSAELVTA
jgi:phosphoserine phosphatase